jgi:PAS domain-containing protein
MHETTTNARGWPVGGGEMAKRIREHDWSATPLGPIAAWPPALRLAIDLMLSARQPACVGWGPGLSSLYNDSYIPILGSKHPKALAQPYVQVWPEIWDEHRLIAAATLAGEAQYFEARPVAVTGRAGSPMSWFTFTWTPIRDESGEVGGFYCGASETTGQHLAEQAVQSNLKWMRGQREAFQAAMNGAPLEAALGILARMVSEETAGEARTAFYVVDPDGACLHPISGAGDMPKSYTQQVDRFPIGNESLACGLASASGLPVLSRDVRNEPRWEPWVHLANAYDFRGCFSFPIETRDGKPVGTFAMYFRAPHEAGPRDLALADVVTQAAAIIISRQTEAHRRTRAEVAQRQSEHNYRELFESIDQGFCTVEVLFESDRPVDYRFLIANPAYERLTGLTDVVGRTLREVIPSHAERWPVFTATSPSPAIRGASNRWPRGWTATTRCMPGVSANPSCAALPSSLTTSANGNVPSGTRRSWPRSPGSSWGSRT